MPGNKVFAASDIDRFDVNGQAFTVSGAVTYRKERVRKAALDDIQSSNDLFRGIRVKGRLIVASFATDRDMASLDITNGTISITFVSGRKIVASGATLITEDGIEENVTTGATNELMYSFKTSTDKSPR